jgi:hypothetical protein
VQTDVHCQALEKMRGQGRLGIADEVKVEDLSDFIGREK